MVPRAMLLIGSASAVLFYGCDGRNPLEPRTVPNSVSAAVKIGSGTSAALNTTATASSTTQIDVAWQDNATDETRFEIHRSTSGPTGTFTLLASTGSNAVAYSDQGLGFGQYCYKVRGVRVNGRNEIYSLFSNTACATLSAPPPPPPPPPAAPSNAQAYAYSTRISLGWQDNSSDETKFEVHRSTTGDAGTFSLLTSVAANIVALSDTGLASGAQYCYKVRAVKVVDTSSYASAFSNTVCATTPAAPATAPPAPSDLDAWPAASDAIAFKFTASTVKTDGFRLYRSTDNGATWTNYWTATGGIYASDPPNVIQFSDGAQPEQRVCYRVIAYNATGDSPPSNVDCTTPPAWPTITAVTRVDDQTVDLSWADNSSVEDGYQIVAYWNSCTQAACSADNVSGTSPIATLPGNSTSFRCANCPATYYDEAAGKIVYLIGFEIFATSDGGRSTSDWGPAP